jgi:hypothetical protein
LQAQRIGEQAEGDAAAEVGIGATLDPVELEYPAQHSDRFLVLRHVDQAQGYVA